MGIFFFGLVRNASDSARRPRQGICFNIANSVESGEPNRLDVQSMSPFKAAQEACVIELLIHWTPSTSRKICKKLFLFVSIFVNLMVKDIEIFVENSSSSLPFHIKNFCYKTTLLSRFKLPATDKLTRWESAKWKRVETATLGAVSSSTSHSNENTPQNLFQTCFIHQKVLWQHPAK